MKKQILRLGAICPIIATTAMAISCNEKEGRKINFPLHLQQNIWLNKANIAPFIQNGFSEKTTSLDFPFFPSSQKETLKNILDRTQPVKTFVENIKNKNIIDLKQVLAKMHEEVLKYKKQNPGSQFVAFHSKRIGVEIKVDIYKLRQATNASDYTFIDNLKSEYDFPSKHPNNYRGVPLRVPWPLKSVDPIKWTTKESKTKPQTWSGLIYNGISTKTDLENEWQKNPVNVITTPFIDFNSKEFKILVVAFKGGHFEEYDTAPYQKVWIKKPESMKYKIIKVNNYLPFENNSTTKTITPQQKTQFKNLLHNIRNWLMIAKPSSINTAVNLLSQTIPHIQMLFENIRPLANKLQEAEKKYMETKSKYLLHDQDYDKIHLYNYSTLDTNLDKFISAFQASQFDFNKINDINATLENNKYKKYDLEWMKKIDQTNQYILVNILLVLKISASVWINL